MGARKNREGKYGTKGQQGFVSEEELYILGSILEAGHATVGVDGVVHYPKCGFDSGKGGVVRGLHTKGLVERREVGRPPTLSESEWIQSSTDGHAYFVTEEAAKLVDQRFPTQLLYRNELGW